ncbi:MAG: MBOAT family protein [Bacteroidales bacterium]|nr:MBOAT family protein [Bacteroidales bacterium]
MVFTSFEYLYFLIILFSLYWASPNKKIQNLLLLSASYIFYGWIHPWFCALIAFSTIVDYFSGLGMIKFPNKKKLFLFSSLVANLGMLAFFKYFDFFSENITILLNNMGLGLNPFLIGILLPVGISFYTFQTLSYTIDIYRGKLMPRKNFIDFAVFVSLFPQLVAGPIERAKRLLPQIEIKRNFSWNLINSAAPLIIQGYLKKLVIADNISVYVDKVFMLEQPSVLLLIAGTLAFTIQIYADFSAYTDIARGSAKLFGFDLIKNFDRPYRAVSPSDFWRRWHISFSTWIRDYLYISLGGSRVKTKFAFFIVLLASLGLSGLWHGAAWNFIIWGIYHAIIVFVYHQLGYGGRWKPVNIKSKISSISIMFVFTVLGWMIFRTPNINWLLDIFYTWNFVGNEQMLLVSLIILSYVAFYSILLLIIHQVEYSKSDKKWLFSIYYGFAIAVIFIFTRDGNQDFIYFQF